MTEQTPKTVVEASWEVVNKVGGINTVVKGKASFLVDAYEQYFMVGPLFTERMDLEFKELPQPEPVREVFDTLRERGIHCVYGQWRIKSNPQTVLIDARESNIDINEVKKHLWEAYGIDSLGASGDFDEPLKWAWAVGMFIELLQEKTSTPIVGHFHEWLAGFALLYLKSNNVNTGTVFTTHATMLGRTICAATDIPLYDDLQNLDPGALAEQLGVKDKYTTEVACAREADIFTTVSEITGLEAEHLLGRKPDVLLFNGIDGDKYPTIEEASILHAKTREQMRDFIDYYFFSHYTFDLDQSLIFFVSGRYEYRNKGLDVLTAALGKLNNYLKEKDHKKTVIVFYFIPGETHGQKTELLEERATFAHMQEYLRQHSNEITRKILRNAQHLDSLTSEDLLSEDVRRHVTRMAQSLAHKGNPPLCTHNIPFEDQDEIIREFKQHGLLNRQEDKVKVIRYPIYLTGSDGLLDLSYPEVVAGSHLGIFPSYYEPWGYTPVEAAVLGVPAITTDLAGFGRFIQSNTNEEGGIFVLQRHKVSTEEVGERLYQLLASFCEHDKFARTEQKLAAKRLSQATEWKTFIKQYFQAHRKALAKHI